MTDMAASNHQTANTVDWHSPAQKAHTKRRYRAERRLKIYGLAAIWIALGLLTILVTSLVQSGYPAFTQTHISLAVDISPKYVKADDIRGGNYRSIVRNGLFAQLPEVTNRRDRRQVSKILSRTAENQVRQAVVQDPDLIGQTVAFAFPASDPLDQFNKGVIPRDIPENQRRASDVQIKAFDALDEKGLVSRDFNTGLFTNADSRFPEVAGLAGAIMGSFYALLVCFLISFPVGIASAVYLEEFAPKNRWTDLIEVNINNLAAVPSVVFGLLALAVFLNFMGMPRSAPLVGGMTLSLMTLPTIIITTRASLKAVPPSIREAALGVGASKFQVMLHHVLPLAMPGILTGTIIGLAQALGETAPLLLIGMNAFITSLSGGIMDPATALPTQVFIWADSPERGFVSRTSAGILVLLGFLILMNGLAIFMRKKFERRW
ncbi:MAG: phosphate ABC transporter permease PstA [Hyphomicrobiales bacterium]